MRGKWVLKGEPPLVDSSSPRWGEKASYYSAVCLEKGEVDWVEPEGNSNAVIWEITVKPDSGGEVVVVLPVTGDGANQGWSAPGTARRCPTGWS